MNNWIILMCFGVLIACSARTESIGSGSNGLPGIWTTEEFQTNLTCGIINISLSDSVMSLDQYFSMSGKINFRNDSTFSFMNGLGKVLNGKYKYAGDSLLMTKDNMTLFDFDVDSLLDDHLYLSTEKLAFFYIEKDSITLQDIGWNVSIVMKKVNEL